VKEPCRTCKVEREMSEWLSPYGTYLPDCSACHKKRLDAYYARERERTRAWSKAYGLKYPEKRRAHMLVGEAMKRGDLIRQPCSVCGKLKTHAHHEDYTKPLDVVWLCPKHHGERHRAMRAEARGETV
jgi:hypothetical protein